MFYQLILKNIQISFVGLQPVLSPAALHKALLGKQLLTFRVGLVDGTVHLVEHDIVEEVFDAQSQRSLGIALLAVCLINQDAQSRAAIEAVVVEDVDTADGCSAFIQINHQTELLVAEQVVVAQQELLDLKTGVRHMRSADTPDGAVVLPKENLPGILGLGTTECYDVVLDEHNVRFVEKTTLPSRLAHNLIAFIR